MTHLNLIPVFNGLIQNQPVQLCNARELHAFVESKQQYTDWIKNRINEYGFIQDEDYLVITERTNGRPRKEYHITLDMGKELGMVERNERGRQIRQYFIRCERKLKALQQPQQLALPMVNDDFKQAMAKMVTYASQYANFQQAITSAQLEEQKRLVEFFFSSIPNGDSYLFVFNKNIQQDIQQASDLLHKLITQ
ncbi:antA/AntB antirepressor family protein [Haemophilus influenzae]|uniref:antA/AntB antirepressor family protein n=1 Tax=Haemophilus influenzae TaxID=727 RepID=UPI000E34CFA8|nr:antA/AntB antirepressor family protein [Haemophilus influenzae]MCK9667267.1 antA/AntB antirepressor family protein [Haemophilus influenzae]RFN74475.1 hypothetical protein CH606_05175 [Haemophilus influenzae]RFO03449.1 hypothetical protein CH604_08475 [Haemophilus influenzae]